VVLAQALGDQAPELGRAPQLGRLRPPGPQPGLLVGEVGAAAVPAAPADLAPDRGVGAPERPGDLAIGVAAGDPARDLLALGQAQAARGPPPRPDPLQLVR
jgi:hypothetical protein